MKSADPFFSIIIPAFNSGKTISNCIDSILKQSFHDWEIVVMDGVSKDDTLLILSKYQEQCSKLKIYSEPDNGIYDAMNKGIEKSRGHWLYFLGSDDTLYNDEVLIKLFNHLQANPYCEIMYGNVWSERFNGEYGKSFTALQLLQENICHQAIFFSKNIFRITGLFNLKYKAHADWDHNLKWVLSPSIKSCYLPIIIACYADGGFSSTSSDFEFNKDKRTNFLQYSSSTLLQNIRLKVLLTEMAKAAKRLDWRRLKRAIQSY